jgi:ParB-like chromosome segregation protein Spo0J
MKRILYQVRLLQQGHNLEPFEVWYNSNDDIIDIYDGWHRIRAYQYMQYKEIPCIIVKI